MSALNPRQFGTGDEHAAVRGMQGTNDLKRMFPGDSPRGMTPWPSAARRRDIGDYDKGRVHDMLRKPPRLEEIDPATVHATQTHLVRGGVRHYLEDDTWKHGGPTYADQGNAGNRYPVVYDRDSHLHIAQQRMLLSGHHRAAAALLKGEPLLARRIEGPWGGPRTRST